ncbi:LPS export ABC transporter periplasmic protein LptC [Tranquillimonas alkanivorans]|uniref:LPS export ABC transporter periplasmic protein LptC n=1 Tax=Tranquillimonas alkanivorans TaxID=441119 RepID=UPI0011605BDB|nr:LPS export ABC transporter periplasmic protein LptC [Tranquillimonas alkanivorans]
MPLIALAILSTLFMFSRQYDPEAAIPFSEAEVEEILQEQRVREPRYAGMTRDGAAVRISADAAQPDRDAPARLTARALEGRVETPDGGWLDIRAGAGGIDQTADTARMEQDVRIETSTGYRIETDTLTTALDATSVASDGAVTAEGPPGELIAGRMEMRPVEGQADRYVLDFTDGVRLLYVPPGE